jgi:hypothetical protein
MVFSDLFSTGVFGNFCNLCTVLLFNISSSHCTRSSFTSLFHTKVGKVIPHTYIFQLNFLINTTKVECVNSTLNFHVFLISWYHDIFLYFYIKGKKIEKKNLSYYTLMLLRLIYTCEIKNCGFLMNQRLRFLMLKNTQTVIIFLNHYYFFLFLIIF